MKKRSIGNIIVIILLLILLIFVICALKKNDSYEPQNNEESKTEKPLVYEKETYLNKVINNSGTTIKDGWQDIIVKYLDYYTNALIKLEAVDVRDLFTEPDGVEAYLANKTLQFYVEHHKMQENDMRLSYAEYNIEYEDIEINDNKVTISFLEDDIYNFNFMKDIKSKIIDVSNTIVLNKSEDGKYTIDSIRIVKDHFVMFSNEIEDYTKNEIDTLYDKYISWSLKEVENNKKLLESANEQTYNQKIKCDNEYNRDEAVKYAYLYADDRNPLYYDFSSIGGNCANYASQALFAGGIPMDPYGSAKWKYYDSSYDVTEDEKGRTPSWTATYYFYLYAKDNSGFGMCSDVDVNIFYASKGDIIQVGYDDYTHTTIAVDVVYKDGKILDILLNSNTVGLENYPMLGYTYENKRLIKILGYNN